MIQYGSAGVAEITSCSSIKSYVNHSSPVGKYTFPCFISLVAACLLAPQGF
jgi:hypothetical protein